MYRKEFIKRRSWFTRVGFWGTNICRNEPYGLKCYFIFRMIFFFNLAWQLEISLLALICFFTVFVRTQKVKHVTLNFWTLSQPWNYADGCMSRWDLVKVSMNMVYILNAFKITVTVALEAGGRAVSHRPSPELCRDVCLPSFCPR